MAKLETSGVFDNNMTFASRDDVKFIEENEGVWAVAININQDKFEEVVDEYGNPVEEDEYESEYAISFRVAQDIYDYIDDENYCVFHYGSGWTNEYFVLFVRIYEDKAKQIKTPYYDAVVNLVTYINKKYPYPDERQYQEFIGNINQSGNKIYTKSLGEYKDGDFVILDNPYSTIRRWNVFRFIKDLKESGYEAGTWQYIGTRYTEAILKIQSFPLTDIAIGESNIEVIKEMVEEENLAILEADSGYAKTFVRVKDAEGNPTDNADTAEAILYTIENFIYMDEDKFSEREFELVDKYLEQAKDEGHFDFMADIDDEETWEKIRSWLYEHDYENDAAENPSQIKDYVERSSDWEYDETEEKYRYIG